MFSTRKRRTRCYEHSERADPLLLSECMQTNEQLTCDAGSSRMFQEFFESSKVLREELPYLRNAATSNLTILITGESGTGKELVACAVHQLSHRSPRAFVRVNCAEIEPQLITSERFDQRKGRRPLTQPRLDWLPLAEGGTIFLKNVDDLVAEAQLGLLRVLRDLEIYTDRKHSPRLIATTRRDLQAATDGGTFLRGLFFRLNQFAVTLPPLRERREDIPALARHFLAEYFLTRRMARAKSRRPALTERSMNLLQSYRWPGNMRELKSVMERFAVLSEANILSVDAKWIPWETVQARSSPTSASGMPMPNETELLEAALMEMLTALPGWERSNE
jgi:formate hydrogenlyase transcriptional activator